MQPRSFTRTEKPTYGVILPLREAKASYPKEVEITPSLPLRRLATTRIAFESKKPQANCAIARDCLCLWADSRHDLLSERRKYSRTVPLRHRIVSAVEFIEGSIHNSHAILALRVEALLIFEAFGHLLDYGSRLLIDLVQRVGRV